MLEVGYVGVHHIHCKIPLSATRKFFLGQCAPKIVVLDLLLKLWVRELFVQDRLHLDLLDVNPGESRLKITALGLARLAPEVDPAVKLLWSLADELMKPVHRRSARRLVERRIRRHLVQLLSVVKLLLQRLCVGYRLGKGRVRARGCFVRGCSQHARARAIGRKMASSI